jgi:hypothetical protein
MIVTSIRTDIDKYYNLDKKTVTKNVFNPITKKFGVEYIQYFYDKVGKLQPTKSVGINLDKYV